MPAIVDDKAIKVKSAIFITFPGNCKMALTFYQSCFGGKLIFETIESPGLPVLPVICGSLVSDNLVIHGSDLVHDEGRIPGNYMAVFLQCRNIDMPASFFTGLKRALLLENS